VKTGKGFDWRSEDIETKRTRERGFEFFHLFLDCSKVAGLGKRSRGHDRM